MTQTLKESFYFFRSNQFILLGYIFSASAVIILLIKLLLPDFGQELTEENMEQFAQVMNLLNLFIIPVYTGALIAMLYNLMYQQKKGIPSCLYAGLIRWPHLLVANIVSSFIVYAGLLLFILPGIWIFSRLFLAPYLIMLNKQSAFKAIIESYRYTEKYSLKILTDVGILMLFFIALLFILAQLQVLLPVVMVVLAMLLHSFLYIIFYRHYEAIMELNKVEELTEKE